MTIEEQLQSAGLSWRIFRDGEQFKKGELCTCRGSLWIAQQDGATSKPGTDGQWKLAVKSGSTAASEPSLPLPQVADGDEAEKLFWQDVAVIHLSGVPLHQAFDMALSWSKETGKVGTYFIDTGGFQFARERVRRDKKAYAARAKR